MRKVWVIACREYQAAVRTKAFVFSIVMMPVLWGASIGLQVLMKKAEDKTTKKVLVVDVFLMVGEFGEAMVDLVELRTRELVAEFAEALLEHAAAAVFAEHHVVGGDADRLGRHDLVGERVGHYAVLVNA